MNDARWLEEAEDAGRSALRRGLDESERFAHSELAQRRVWARVSGPVRARRATRGAFLRGAFVASTLTAMAIVALDHVHVATPARGPDGARPAPSPTSSTTAFTTSQTGGPAPLAVVAASGAVVETGAGERLVRILPRRARAELAPRTSVAVDEQGRPELRRGEVRFSVAAPATRDAQLFSVRVASYRVVVAGARFVLKAEAQSVSLAVDEGEAEIWNGSHVVRLGSGEAWSSNTAPRGRPATPRAARDKAPALAPDDVSSGAAAQDSDDLAAARAARAASDPRRALTLYERLASRTGPAAENALYEIGGVYHDQLGQPAKAIAAWDRYRARYPNGLLRAEADLSVIDTLATLGPSAGGARTLDEALAFLARYPRSERRGEVARVAGDLYRERGDYRAALDAYRLVSTSGTTGADDADDAAFGQAACLYALRDGGAGVSLRAYLARRPHGRHAGDAARLLGGQRDGRGPNQPDTTSP
jgi:hypothetical protein